ncbi:MAG: NB-ARC domain-containing protein [Cyanobacteria bacterium P01_H01_bin.15]
MDIEDAISVLDTALGAEGLNDLEISIFRQVWAGEKYADIAESLGYDANYIKDLGGKIWKHLSQSLGEKVTKSNVQSVLRRHQSSTVVDSIPEEARPKNSSSQPLWDWSEEVNTSNFIGRQPSLTLLSDWLQEPSCRLVWLVGMAGLGKTTLAARLVEHNAGAFAGIVWRSLNNPLPLSQLLQDLLTAFRVPLPAETPIAKQMQALLQTLKEHRYLLVLDHTETLIQAGNITGDYRTEYEDYRTLFQQLNSTRHESCVLIISREQFQSQALSEGEIIRSHVLPPLTIAETQTLFQTKGTFTGQPEHWEQLVQQYSGNTLALKIVSTTIFDLFQGNLSEFLAEGQILFEGLAAFLKQQWQQLSANEQWVLYYLAVHRNPASFKTIKADLLDTSQRRRLSDTLSALQRRTLLESKTDSDVLVFGLQSSVMEFSTVHLVEKLAAELAQSQPNLLHRLPLLKIDHQDYLQQAQRQQVLQPILENFNERCFVGLETQFAHLLTQQQNSSPSYAAGNLVNLWLQSGKSIAGQDFSRLPLWEVDFTKTSLHRVNLSHADLSRSLFAHAFGGVTSACLSLRDDRFMTGHENGRILVWETATGRQVQCLDGHQSWIWGLVRSPDGNYFLSASEDRTVRVWEYQTGRRLHSLKGHSERIWQVACLNNEIAVTASSDRTLKVWNFIKDQCLMTLETDAIALAVSDAESLIFSGGTDGQLHCWNRNTGERLDTWSSHHGGIWALAYCQSTQTLYSAGDGGIIEAWQRRQLEPITTLGQPGRRIWSLALSACDRYLVAGGDSNQLIRWDLQSREIEQNLGGYKGRISAVDCGSTDDIVLTASADQTIRLWDMRQGQPLLNICSYCNWACEVAVTSRDNGEVSLIAGAYEDGNLYLWNRETGECDQILQGHQCSIWSLATSPVGPHIVSGDDEGILRIWDLGSGRCQQRLNGHHSRIWSVAWSPDGATIASGSGDRTLKLWDANSGYCRHTLNGHHRRIWSVSFSHDGQWVASGSGDRTVKLWDSETGLCHATLEGHHSLISSVAFHPHLPIMASGSGDGTCKLWDLETNLCQATIPTSNSINWSIAWSPNGNLLAVGGDKGQIKLWNHTQQRWEFSLPGQTECIWSIVFSRDSKILCSGSQDGTTRLWNIESRQCSQVLQPPRLYEDLNIMDATGLNIAQIETLKALGAKT